MNRLEILKTYKIYIGGQFPRTESGRSYQPLNSAGKPLANMCLSSRKDVRNAVVAARKAFGTWSERSAFNRGQILYRIAEMLESRKTQFVEELVAQGSTEALAEMEVHLAIDRIVYYAGWCDKYQQVMSSVNPVASSHFNFSVAEPMGVVGLHAPADTSLIGLISLLMPILVGGNTAVVIASEQLPLCAITFAEVLNSSDVPAGVVNILTGKHEELKGTLVAHMDVNAVVYGGDDSVFIQELETAAIGNLKRTFAYAKNWMDENAQDMHCIADLQEIKTTWHPIEHIGGATSSY
jgi:acyl-CoA reductase-like NAD-dependent aldehyde dehydrogenase